MTTTRTREQIQAEIFLQYAQLGACVTGLDVTAGMPEQMARGFMVYTITHNKIKTLVAELFDMFEPCMRRAAEENDAKNAVHKKPETVN